MRAPKSVIGVLAATLIGACVSTPTVSPSEPHGIITTELPSGSNVTRIIQIAQIDGVNYGGSSRTVWLAPGIHTLRVVASVQSTRGTATRFPGATDGEARVLEIDVVEGKRYLIGAIVPGPSADDWVPVVVEISDI